MTSPPVSWNFLNNQTGEPVTLIGRLAPRALELATVWIIFS